MSTPPGAPRGGRSSTVRDRAARTVLALSGLAAAVPALLPALIAGLLVLFDVSARALLGTSGSLLGVAGALLPGSGSLPPAARISVDPGMVALRSLGRGIPPVCMVAFAIRPHRAAALLAAAATLLSGGTLGAIAAGPGVLAALAMSKRRGVVPGTRSDVVPGTRADVVPGTRADVVPGTRPGAAPGAPLA